MRYLIITDCRDCSELRRGPQLLCAHADRFVPVGTAVPIPDWCPRLATHTGPECPGDCERHRQHARYCDISLSGCIRNAEDYYKPKG